MALVLRRSPRFVPPKSFVMSASEVRATGCRKDIGDVDVLAGRGIREPATAIDHHFQMQAHEVRSKDHGAPGVRGASGRLESTLRHGSAGNPRCLSMYSSTRCIRAEYSAWLAFLVEPSDSENPGVP